MSAARTLDGRRSGVAAGDSQSSRPAGTRDPPEIPACSSSLQQHPHTIQRLLPSQTRPSPCRGRPSACILFLRSLRRPARFRLTRSSLTSSRTCLCPTQTLLPPRSPSLMAPESLPPARPPLGRPRSSTTVARLPTSQTGSASFPQASSSTRGSSPDASPRPEQDRFPSSTAERPSSGASCHLPSLVCCCRPSLTLQSTSTLRAALRRNKSLSSRTAGSLLHAAQQPSPIPPSLQNSPYLQSESSPFFRRAHLGRASTSSVVPTLKSLSLNGPPSSVSSPTQPAFVESRPAGRRPKLERNCRSYSDSTTSLSSDSEAIRTPPPPTQARLSPSLADYPTMTSSSTHRPAGKPTEAALKASSGGFEMERIDRPVVRVCLAEDGRSSS